MAPIEMAKVERLCFDALENYRLALDHDRGVWVKALTLLPTAEELKELKDAREAVRNLVAGD